MEFGPMSVEHLGQCRWAGEGFDGVHIFAPDGQRIDKSFAGNSEQCLFWRPKRNRSSLQRVNAVRSLCRNARRAHRVNLLSAVAWHRFVISHTS